MKIAIATDRVYPYFKGGAEKRYWDIAQRLKKNGHEVTFYTGQWPKMKKREVKEGINLIGVYKVGDFYVNGKKSIKESIKYSLRLLPFLLKGDYDVLDCEQMPILSLFPSKLASIIKGKPLYSTWHEAWDRGYWRKYLGTVKGDIGYLIEKFALMLPNQIISISDHTTNNLINELRINRNKIVTIPCGIDVERIKKVKLSKEISDVIFVGRLLNHKNVDVLIRSMQHLKDKKLIIIGDGPEREKLEKLAKDLNLSKSVVFKGFIEEHDDVLSLIKSSKVFVLPSTREGFGMTVIEANACGIPVVTVNHKNNASKNLIKNSKNGYLSRLNEKDLTKYILKTIKNSDRMKKNCIIEAEKYNWDNLINKIEEVYR